MHPNPAFRQTTDPQNIAFVRDRAFGTLAINGEAGPITSHIPFLLSENDKEVEFHLMRSNPIFRALDGPTNAVLTILGPDSYISPDWYDVIDQVPTWNYVAVRLHGSVERVPHDTLRPMLDRLSAHFEDRLTPKTPWKTDKMTDGVMDRMMRAIAPCKMMIEDIHGTWKLNQNKPDDVRLRASDHVEKHGIGSEIELLAALMRDAK